MEIILGSDEFLITDFSFDPFIVLILLDLGLLSLLALIVTISGSSVRVGNRLDKKKTPFFEVRFNHKYLFGLLLSRKIKPVFLIILLIRGSKSRFEPKHVILSKVTLKILHFPFENVKSPFTFHFSSIQRLCFLIFLCSHKRLKKERKREESRSSFLPLSFCSPRPLQSFSLKPKELSSLCNSVVY